MSLKLSEYIARRPVSELMSKDVISVNESMPLTDFIKTFDRRLIHHILVENELGQLVGIISQTDLDKNRSFYLEEKLLASHLMTENPVTVSSSTTLNEAAEILRTNRFRALPVLEKGELVGIITPYDFLSFFVL